MTLTPEQFNSLLKENLKDFATKEEMNNKFDQVLTVVDAIAKDVKDIKEENVSNLMAHDRIQKDVNEVRQHAGLKIKHPVME